MLKKDFVNYLHVKKHHFFGILIDFWIISVSTPLSQRHLSKASAAKQKYQHSFLFKPNLALNIYRWQICILKTN